MHKKGEEERGAGVEMVETSGLKDGSEICYDVWSNKKTSGRGGRVEDFH